MPALRMDGRNGQTDSGSDSINMSPMQLVRTEFLWGERAPLADSVPTDAQLGCPPGDGTTVKGDREAMVCKETNCRRRAHSLGWCTTHYRRSRSGQPMDAPIRRYGRRIKWKREKPFAAEYALLAELGLRRN